MNKPLPGAPLHTRADVAVKRFDPTPSFLRDRAAEAVACVSRAVMTLGNRIDVIGLERLHAALADHRGLLTFSNHVSLFDDPLITACLVPPAWGRLRWIAADAINFFDTPLKAAIFNAGKAVPIIRGGGIDQPGMHFLAQRLTAGEWVHVFPEGGRTRDPLARLRQPLKPGMAHLIRATRPLVLPFHHIGMEHVLPIGARSPRFGHRVTVQIGEVNPLEQDLAGQSIDAITQWAAEQLLSLKARGTHR